MASISEDNFNPEEDLLGTLDDLDIGFVKVSNDDIILNHNLTFNKIFGYDPEKNLIGTKTLDYWLNPEERNKFREILFKNGIVKKFIAPAKKVDGEKIFLEITIKLIKNSNGEIISSEGTFVDVTERIETEQKLRESEEKYRLITENANDLIAVLDDGLKYKYVNKGYELLGYSKEEIYNSQVTDLLHPDDVKRAIKAFRKGLTSGTGLEELRIKHKDGKFFWFEVKGKTFKDLNGETNALLVSRDITERKQIEQGLKESEKKLKILFENANDAISIHDLKGNFYTVNKTYCERLGYTREELLKLTPRDICTLKYADLVASRVLEVKEKGFSIFESVHKTKDGRVIPVEISSRSIQYDNKPSIISIIRDISERKKAELKLKESKHKLAEKVKELTVLYELSNLVEISNISIENIIHGILNLIPPAMQYPDITTTRITYKDRVYSIDNFRETKRKLAIEVKINKKTLRIEVCYLEDKPFLNEENDLLIEIGTRLKIKFDEMETQEKLKESEHKLAERVKELTCLYRLSKIVENPNISSEAILRGTLDLIPPAWQFPEITCARINFDNKEFKTSNFKESEWKLSTNINVHEEEMNIEVYYLEEKSFLREEEHLISDLGKRLKSIIEQRETQQKLRASEEWLSTTLKSIGDAVIVTDRLGNIQFVNPITEDLTGFKREESIGKPIEDVFNILNEETRKSVENPVTRVIREGIIVGLANHTMLIAKDGKKIPIADSGAPIKDDKGNLIGIVVIFRDITENREKEKKILDLAHFPSENPYPILRVNRNRVMYINEAGQKLLNIVEHSQIPKIFQESV
ncbi:hypothetical protein LCGC14_1886280, partial [marine sediment metagenome]